MCQIPKNHVKVLLSPTKLDVLKGFNDGEHAVNTTGLNFMLNMVRTLCANDDKIESSVQSATKIS